MRFANHSRIADSSSKMRSNVGAIVSRSSSVSFTSKTIRGRSDMGADLRFGGARSRWAAATVRSAGLLSPSRFQGRWPGDAAPSRRVLIQQ